MEIKISSLNVRGIGDEQKRSELFNWLRSKKFSLYLLQEVHCSNDTISIWSSEWGYKSLFSCFSSAKGGVAILFNNNFSFKFFGYIWTQMVDLLSVTLKLKGNVLPWLLCTPQTKMNPTFSKTFLTI